MEDSVNFSAINSVLLDLLLPHGALEDPSILSLIGEETNAITLLKVIDLATQRLTELNKDGNNAEYAYSYPDEVRVTRDYKIFVNDCELHLSPIAKAVYLLFLNHPDGIRFKDLSDYRDELETLYGKVAPYRDRDAIISTIDRLINPSEGAMSECKSRINSLIGNSLFDNSAHDLMISGERGKFMSIKINRTHVIREDMNLE